MRHPSSDKRAAQFMFASPRRAKHVRTSSCAKALARISYTRGLASFFIVLLLHRTLFLTVCDHTANQRAQIYDKANAVRRNARARLRAAPPRNARVFCLPLRTR